MKSIRNALRLSFIERYFLIFLALLSSILLARLLTPTEIGIYSVTAALVGIAQVIREFGVGTYLIQESDLSQAKLDTALGISCISGSLIFVGVFASASLIGSFYGDIRVDESLRVIALNFLILPICSIAMTMLRRAMRFDQLLVANLLGGVAGFVVTISLALIDHGPESLAWGSVTCNLVTAGISWKALENTDRPKRLRLSEWRTLVTYGKQTTLAGVVVSASMDINDLVLGKVLGFSPVAILSRAMGLMNLFQRDLMGAARNVAFPAFAQAFREGKPLEPMFVSSFAMVTGMGWPFYGFLALYPLESLRLLAGPQWDAAQPIVVIFSAAGAIVTTVTFVQVFILSMGRVDLASKADITVSLLKLTVGIVAALIFESIVAVAYALLASFAIAVPIFFSYKNRCSPNDWSGLLRNAARSMAVTIFCLLIPAFISFGMGLSRKDPLPHWAFALICMLALLMWVVALRVLDHPISRDSFYQKLFNRIGIRYPSR